MSSDPKRPPANQSPSRNWLAAFISICLAAGWFAKRGVDYLQQRYPDTPLLEALSNAISDNASPQVTTSAPEPLTTPQAAPQPPINRVTPPTPAVETTLPPPASRITPRPNEASTFRADFNPNANGANTNGTTTVVTTPEPQPEQLTPTERKPGTVYALLVGIDTYPRGIRSLRGCVNDVNYFETYLHNRVAKDNDIPLVSIKKLTNLAATRQAIIHAWRTHLSQAGAEDVALFYYAGHGTQSRAPSAFNLLEPDNKLESLVCYDSRTATWDLADQEIGQLIAEVAENNPHIITIFDCCNSGTVTRAIEGESDVRQVPLDPRNRPLDTFVLRPQTVNASGQIEQLPQGRHVVLSACQAFELAQEKRFNGERRGVFSYYLLDSLQRVETPPTYRDLFKRVNALVRANATRQSPMLEATDSADLQRPFLGGKTESGRPYFTLAHSASDGWTIDGGAVHGIKPIQRRMTTWLSLFPATTPNNELLDINQLIGYAKVTEVLPASCRVQIRMRNRRSADIGTTYKAVVNATSMRPMGVRFEGDPDALQLARTALQTAGVGGARSVFATESEDNYHLRLLAQDGAYRIQSADDAYNLAVEVEQLDADSARQAVSYIEHIARWQTLLDLENSTSRLATDLVTLKIESRDDAQLTSDTTPTLRLRYQQDEADVWQKPRIRLSVTNHSERRLYCSIVALSQAYGVFHVRSDWVEPGDSFSRNGRSRVNDSYWNAGVTTTTDVYKLIVSTDELDFDLAAQEELPIVFVRQQADSAELPSLSSLDALLAQVGARTFEPEDDAEPPLRDWYSRTITVQTIRPQHGRALSAFSTTAVSDGVRIDPHPLLGADVRLSTLAEATRDLREQDVDIVPPIFRRNGVLTHPLALDADSSRSGQPELNVLELFNVDNAQSVTEQTPLTLTIHDSAAPGDLLLPLAYDGEFYVPLGIATATEQGWHVAIHRLPSSTGNGTRDIGNSIRILFQKLVGQRLGLEYTYPQLAIAQLAGDEEITVTYESDQTLVQQAVANAQRVLLYVHGIFDDTRLLASSAAAGLQDRYDLILTFDYENLDTPIRQNGQHLFDRLSEAGFNAEDEKQLDIVAHSMGGLVSRSMIEQWGGSAFVNHLMTVGTPHGGTPWARVEDLALVGITAVINGLTTVTWPLRVIAGMIQAIEKFDTTLDNMAAGSNFLQGLNAANDPHVPYTLVSGDTGLIHVGDDSAESGSRLQRLLGRLTGTRLRHQLATLIGFFGEPNDIAVSVHSARAVPADRDPQPIVLPTIASDHTAFFRTELGLKTIADNLPQND